MTSGPSEERRPASMFFGALLMAVGVLMMVVCGLCSLAFGSIGPIAYVLALGVVPFGMGLMVVYAGYKLYSRTYYVPPDRGPLD